MPSHGDAETVLRIRATIQGAMVDGTYDIRREMEIASEFGITTRTVRWHRAKIEKREAKRLSAQTADEQQADLLGRVRYGQRLAVAPCIDKDGVERPTDLKAFASLVHTEARILGQLRDRVSVEHSGTVNVDVRALVVQEIRQLTDDQLDTACERIEAARVPELEVLDGEATK